MRALLRAVYIALCVTCCTCLHMELELHIDRFENSRGVLANGSCCSGRINASSQVCTGRCNTFARICVTVRRGVQFSSFPTPGDDCDVVDNLTGLLGHNALDTAVGVRTVPKAWKPSGAFTIIVQLYHSDSVDPNEFNSSKVNRLSANRVIARGATHEEAYMPGQNWTNHRTRLAGSGELVYSYRVRCSPNRYGSSCQRMCFPRDDIVGHFTCDSEGRRVCLPGYEGELCRTPVCQPDCGSNGICDGPNHCRCYPGWTGAGCTQCVPVSQCSRSHGYCNNPQECVCRPGYGGIFCDIDLEWCRHNPNPCENGGLCVNRDRDGYNYTCVCPAGYTGFHCERPPNDCLIAGGCLNGGVCVQVSTPSSSSSSSSSSTAGACTCPPGYTGSLCQFNASRCAHRPCQGGGACVDLPTGGFRCHCQPGWAGRNCEVNVNDCHPDYCLNGGQCVDHVNTFQCVCRHNFRGSRCSVNLLDCGLVLCLNGGVCRDRADGIGCHCPPGFSGKFCGTPPLTAVASSAGDSGVRETSLIAAFGFLVPVAALLGCALAATYRRYRRRLRGWRQQRPLSSPDSPRASASASESGKTEKETVADQPVANSNNNNKSISKNLLPTGEEKTAYFAAKRVNNALGISPASTSSTPSSASQSLLISNGLSVATVSGSGGCFSGHRWPELSSRQLLPSPQQHQQEQQFHVVAVTEV